MLRFRTSLLLCLIAISTHASFFCRMHDYAFGNGLLQSHISNAQQDASGFMWFATWNGIVRFDGHTFNTFKPILLSNGTIFSNRIYNIKQNASGNLWCISSDNRLFLFDRQSNTFTDILQQIPLTRKKKVKVLTPLAKGITWVTFRDFSCLRLHDSDYRRGYLFWASGSPSLLGSKKILDIVQDEGGDEWVLTDKGVVSPTRKVTIRKPMRYVKRIGDSVYFVSTSGEVAVLRADNKVSYSHLVAPATRVQYVSSTPSSLLLATDKGLTVLNCRTRTISTHPTEELIYLYTDSRHRTWAFGRSNTVWLLTPDGATLRPLSATPLAGSQPMKNPQLIFENAQHQVILKPEGGVLSYYDEGRQQLSDCLFFDGNQQISYAPTEISKFLIDHQHNLWIFQKHAANCISFYPNHFSHWQNPSKSEVRALFHDDQGRRWVSDKSNALYLLSGSNNTPLYLTGSGSLTPQPTAFSHSPIYKISQDRQHRLWIGTKGDGAYLLSPANEARTSYRVSHFLHQPHDALSLHSDTIWNILPDSRGAMWLGSYEGGLAKGVAAGERWTFRKVKNFPDSLKIRCLLEYRPGILLIGTTNGLLVADLRNEHRPVYHHNAFRNEEWGLKGNDVMSIVRSNNRYYVCVFGSGVSEIVSDNLLNDSIHFRNHLIGSQATADQVKTAIACGKDIWLMSAQAVVRYSTATNRYTIFDQSCFLGDFNFSEGSPIIDGNQIIAATSDGILSFPPSGIQPRKSHKQIVFTGIQYQNDMAVSPLNDIESLTIAPDERSFSLYLSTLSYDEMRDFHFRYQLEGYDNGWNYAGENQHAVNYNSLPPGDYTLSVQVLNESGSWTEISRSIDIHVTPRFVETVWFRIALLLLFAAAIVGMIYAIIYLSRMRSLLQKKYSLLMTVDQYSTDIKIEKPLVEDTEDKEFLKKTIAFFEENISNGNFVVEDFARHMGMSRTAYYNKLKAITGLSPIDFIKQMRIKKALKLLEDPSLTVADIAYKTGFSDPKYFSKCFKAEMGMTPTQYVNKKAP